MRRRIAGTVLWLFLLVVVGIVRCLWILLRATARDRRVLLPVALFFAASSANAFTEQFSLAGVGPLGHMILAGSTFGVGTVVLLQGAWSPWVRMCRRRLRARGWC